MAVDGFHPQQILLLARFRPPVGEQSVLKLGWQAVLRRARTESSSLDGWGRKVLPVPPHPAPFICAPKGKSTIAKQKRRFPDSRGAAELVLSEAEGLCDTYV